MDISNLSIKIQMMRSAALALLASSVLSALVRGEVFFEERFDSPEFEKNWKYPVKSAKSAELGKFALSSGNFYAEKRINQGLKTTEDSKFYALSSKLAKPFSNKGKPLVFQFSVKHEQTIDCGGGYL